MSEELVTFFKALADKNRLKIVGLLAEKAYSVEELSELLQLKPPTVSHHLAKLVEAADAFDTATFTSSINLCWRQRRAACSRSRNLPRLHQRWTRMPTIRRSLKIIPGGMAA
jgi:DNA-binding MarR family transcriptional regulator